MDTLELIKEQINSIKNLKHSPAYNAEYQIWENTTEKLVEKLFGKEYLNMFKSARQSQMAMSPEHQYHLFLESLEKKEQLLDGFIKEYERFNKQNLSNLIKIDDLNSYDFHPKIKEVSDVLFIDGHYPQAVEEAFKRVIKEVKLMYKDITGNSLNGDTLMNRAFGCDNQVPVIKFNSLSSDEEIDEQRGIMYLFKGIVGIRNRKAHDNVILKDSNKAIEYLALASLLIRLLEISIR